jgi:hypothetical protein
VAAGVDDVSGTRLFHSLYVVASQAVPAPGAAMDVSVGYGADPLHADVRVLDGWFGGLEVRPWPWAAARLDFDTEKWNSGASLTVADRLSLDLVLLHLDTVSGGVHWTHRL